MDLAEARVGEGASIPLVCVVISSIPVAVNWTRNYLPLSLGQVCLVWCERHALCYMFSVSMCAVCIYSVTMWRGVCVCVCVQ